VESTPKKFRPYIPWRTFFNLLTQMEERGLPARIDRSYLQGKSGADQSYIISTLKSFGLITQEGAVEPSLRTLVQAKDERPASVANLLRANYAEAFALADNATQQQLDEVFRAYGLNGATLRKAETFLLHGAAYAGLKLSPHFATPRQSTAPASRGGSKRKAVKSKDDSIPPKELEKPTEDDSVTMRKAYFELLRKKVDESTEIDSTLLDRMERLMGMDPPGSSGK
jgi:hypothetical protein